MSTQCLIKTSEYHDSITLMQIARELVQLPGVVDVAVVMATEANRAILRQAGLLRPEIDAATPNDLVVAVLADSDDHAERALYAAEARLAARDEPHKTGSSCQLRTIRAAARGANLAIVSVAGQYAAAEAWEALKNGLHVLLFSDNVSIEDEIALKRYAVEHGLLMMGADCGTAILNGVALCFANAVPRGSVGLVAASGTGLQEVSTLLARLGVGVSQGIGTGGRDLKEAVGGLTMIQGLKALQADPGTRVLVLISKPPAQAVAERVLAQVRQSDKPAVVCFLGGDPSPIVQAGAIPARTLQEAAYLAAAEIGHDLSSLDQMLERERAELKAQAEMLRGRLKTGQRYLRGLFSGGTLASEALVIWQEMLDGVWSNVPLDPRFKLADAAHSRGHCAVDLGEDEFTVGRPHPMLDHDLRIRRLLQEAADPEVAVILLDVVLGYGVHPDPAGELGPAIREARQRAARDGRELIVVASITGTEGDPQQLGRQVRALEEAGTVIASCNAAAARLTGYVVAGKELP
ncbi:MAG: acyl-CoA synthetase FdrA [Anaerolineae bacterium]|nr:acyl-CoA synthetase FdrA [Anaerolineae bacterium]